MSSIVNVTHDLIKDPFRIIFLEYIAENPSLTLQDKALLLTTLEAKLLELEINSENTNARDHWLTITSSFSAALAIAGMSSVLPPFGLLFGGLSIVSAAVTFGASQKNKVESSPVVEILKRHRLALESQQAIQWSALWQYTNTDLFCSALWQAAKGYVSGNGSLLRKDGDTPFSAAIAYVARCQGINYDVLVAKLSAIKNGQQELQPLLLPETQVTLPSVGIQTKLNAVEVQSVEIPVEVQQVETKVTLPREPVRASVPTALSIVLNDPYESRAMFGAQRTGKSYFAAVASRMLAEDKGTKIYHINLASYGTEDSEYWQHVTDSVCCDISSMNSFDAFYHIEKAIELIKTFYLESSPAILVCDEIAYLGSTGNAHKEALIPLLNILADKITVLSSSGKKRQKAIWTIAPEFVAGAITQDAKAVKKLSLCYLSIHPKKSVDWNGQAIKFSTELFDQIKNNFTILEPYQLPDTDRVAFINNCWMPIGELQASEKKVTLPKDTAKLQLFIQELTDALKRSKHKGQLNLDKMLTHPRVKELGLTREEVQEAIQTAQNNLSKVGV